MRIEHLNVCGTPTLSEVEGRLRERGYRMAEGPLAPGLYAWGHSEAAPGWSDWMYDVAVALLPGDELAALIAGIG